MKQLEKFKELYPEYTVIFLHISGSTLYGTQLPTSDKDYRGIFLPSLKDLVLKKDIDQWTSNSNGKDSKNSSDDEDFTLWSVHKFIKLLQVGDTNAFDTLFAYGSHCQIGCHELFKEIYNNRECFYPESLRSFFGYALGQVKMYSVKGDKLHDILSVKSLVQGLMITNDKLKDVITQLPVSQNLKVVSDDTTDYYQVLDKRFITNIRLSEFMEKLIEMESKYGTRAKASMENNLVDWKSMYHAFRVLDECQELMTHGTISFPLETSERLLSIRLQHWKPEFAFKQLEELYDSVSALEKTDGNYLKKVKRNSEKFEEILWKYIGLVGPSEISS